jgi:hypothetical protein
MLPLSHHFIPKKKNNRVVFINPGHACTFNDGIGSKNRDGGMQRTINRLLSEGFSVLAVYMPRQSLDNCVSDPHNDMFKISTTGSPMKFFLEPTAISLNYLKANFPVYQDFNMVGLSGGGWTTTVYAAIDPRIKLSIPVAGTLPLYLRYGDSLGDKEQNFDNFYRIAGYLDLYILSSYGSGRKQIQVLNRKDDCCFGERHHDVAKAGRSYDVAVREYEARVKTTLKKLNSGSFALYIDEVAPFHTISDRTILNIILPVLNGKTIKSSSQPSIGKVPNLCKELQNKSITLNANGYLGRIGSTGIKLKEVGIGRFEFNTEVIFTGKEILKEFGGPIRNQIIGLCQQDNSITMSRTLVNVTVQYYTGRIYKVDTGGVEMEGNFKEDGKSYKWRGWINTSSQ